MTLHAKRPYIREPYKWARVHTHPSLASIDDFIYFSNWITINNPKYGNCYIFNYNTTNANATGTVRSAKTTGSSSSLSIELYLDQTVYTPLSLSQEAGARMTIHDPSTYPMVDEYGMNFRPNTASNIGIQQVHVLISKNFERKSYDPGFVA